MLNYLMALIRSRRSEDGASAVEYGLMVAAIAAAIVVIVFLLGDVVTEVFQDTCDEITAQTPTEAGCAPAGG
jgi:pilus assembly protein Flp/PilA